MHDTSAPKTTITPNRLPGFWDRDIVFFANLLALFFGNEAETAALSREVGEVDSYGGRLIPILNLLFRGPDNLLVLERAPDSALCEYFDGDLGLTLPDLHIMGHRDYQRLASCFEEHSPDTAASILAVPSRHPARWIDGFVTDTTLTAIAGHLGKRTIATSPGSRAGNNKLLLHRFLARAGLPVIDTEVAASREEIIPAATALAARGHAAAVLKAPIGASGIGMMKIPRLDSADAVLAGVPDHFFFEGPVLVQAWLAPGMRGVARLRSPSVQLFLDDATVFLYDTTEQILSHDSVHEGNVSPPPYRDEMPGIQDELDRQASLAGAWLHRQGYRGTASADFLVVERDGGGAPEVYLCEINARVTGATYPSILARHFTPRGAWLLRNLRLRTPVPGKALLKMLAAPGHLFFPPRTEGILPINFNLRGDDLVHKGQFLCLAESPSRCFELLATAEHNLPVDWAPDRD